MGVGPMELDRVQHLESVPKLGLKLCHCHLEILNNLWTTDLHFYFVPGPATYVGDAEYQWCSQHRWSYLRISTTLPVFWVFPSSPPQALTSPAFLIPQCTDFLYLLPHGLSPTSSLCLTLWPQQVSSPSLIHWWYLTLPNPHLPQNWTCLWALLLPAHLCPHWA